MKKYIIDNQLVYNAEDRSLSRVGDELAYVVLTHIAGRLLTLLLESRGEIVLRDIILQRVWDDYGLASSNNNLNHYISNSRKQFSSLGLEKTFIITEPKRGFRLNADVTIEEQVIDGGSLPPVMSEIIAKGPEKAHAEIEGSLPIKPTEIKPRRLLMLKKWVTVMMVCILSTLIGYRFIMEDSTIHRHIRGIQYVLNEGSCPVYTTERNLSAEHAQNDRTILAKILRKSNISCADNDIIIAYFAGVFENERYEGQAFVAKCRLNKHTVLSCNNRYIYSVKAHEA